MDTQTYHLLSVLYLTTDIQIGKRHGKPVVFVIRAKDFVDDGHTLYRSSNGVWLAENVPAEYFTVKNIL